jgi:hypothetical protein
LSFFTSFGPVYAFYAVLGPFSWLCQIAFLDRMDAPYAYEMRKWTQNEVVAGFESQFSCLKTTITIERSTKECWGSKNR